MQLLTSHISPLLDDIVASIPAILPEATLIATFVLSIFTGLFFDRVWRHATLCVTLLGIALAGYFVLSQLGAAPSDRLFMGMAAADRFSIVPRILIDVSCLLFVLFVHWNPQFRAHKKKTADLYTVLLALLVGLHFMTMTSHWLMLYLTIEMVSVGSYIMVGYLSHGRFRTEAAMKYVLFGATCSAIMLYGLSLLYGLTGNLDFASAQHIAGLTETQPWVAALAIVLVFVGLGFKLSFVPFHFWVPDVYQGAPTPITAFLSTAPKIAAVALLARLIQAWPRELGDFAHTMHDTLLVATIATLLFGNLAALRQQNIKRLMAYSSIGHTGFLMMAALAYSGQNHHVLLYYLAVYSVMNMGVFMLVDYVETRTGALSVQDYAGLGKRFPLAWICFVILLVSLTGIPPTAGFVGKLLVFSAVFDQWIHSGQLSLLLALIAGALTTVISLFFYFKVPLYAFLRKAERTVELRHAPQGPLWVAVLLTALILLLGVFPQLLTGWV